MTFNGLLAGPEAVCHIWSDVLAPKGAEVLAAYTSGEYAGKAAITSNKFGNGKAIYVGAHLEPKDLSRVLLTLITDGGVANPLPTPAGVEVTKRGSGKMTWTYLLNHNASPQPVPLTGSYKDAITGAPLSGSVTLEPYGVRVLV